MKHQVPGMDHPFNSVPGSAVYRHMAVRAFTYQAQDLVQGGVCVNCMHESPGDHKLPGGHGRQVKCAFQALVLVLLQQAPIPALGDEKLDFLGRMDMAVPSVRHPHPFHQCDAAAVQHGDEPGHDAQGELHGHDRVESSLGRVLQGQ